MEEMADGEDTVSACQQTVLPAAEFHGLWESLVYDGMIKRELLQYSATAMLFSDRHIDTTVISWNR